MSQTIPIATTEENVFIRSGACSVKVRPQFGGKIASLRIGKRELLQQPLSPVLPRTRTMPFETGDASGWDECFPSVAECTVQGPAGQTTVPDHGDLWRLPWEPVQSDSQSLALRASCFSLPIEFERSLRLVETGNASSKGWRLSVIYKISNLGDSPVPWSWAAHPLYLAEEGDRIHLPSTIQSLRVEGSRAGRLGSNGDTVSWPIADLAAGGQSDLSVSRSPESGIGDKLFTGRLGSHENWCVLERPKAGVRIRVQFDSSATPYLGLWICYGGWPERPGPKQTCVALEPATAPVDSLAQSGPWSRTLLPGETYSWPMVVDIEMI